MPISIDPTNHPHTVPNDQDPQPGDLVYGRDGLFAVCYVSPRGCFGLLTAPGYVGVVEIAHSVYHESFETRILVKESVSDVDPSIRMQ